ncbi:MAG TPA: endonuclease/exonuclease/phosphatase family protein [Cyclobacteriaceae bacterium]|nr:endonuclease/exonuclease/phosphatase family protein [Cyclobacteriaceae bacterium]
MRHALIKLSVALFLCCSMMAGASAQDRSLTLRVLTYNIYHGEAADGSVDMDLLASIINEVKPDLVALQEVDKNTQRTGGIDITEELARRTGLKGYFVKHRDFQGGEYGNAILSRFPVTDIDAIEGYHSTPSIITFAFATVEVASGEELIFGCAHLTTRSEDRKEQARQLMKYYVETKNRAPMVLTGDLNAEPHHEELKLLLTEFAEADTTLGSTYPSRSTPVKKIDYILYPRTPAWTVKEARTICREDASDHCAVFAVLQYTPAADR